MYWYDSIVNEWNTIHYSASDSTDINVCVSELFKPFLGISQRIGMKN